MPPSKLPFTNRCHFCSAPTDTTRFCVGTTCQRDYWNAHKPPKAKVLRAKREVKPKPEKEFTFTACFAPDDVIAKNIEALGRLNDANPREPISAEYSVPGKSWRCRRVG